MFTRARTASSVHLETGAYSNPGVDGALVVKQPLAREVAPAQPSNLQWAIDILTPLSLLLCTGLAVWGLTHLGQMIIGPARVQVCNGFDYSAAHAQCSAPDPFVVLGQGTGDASLQIAVPGTIGRSGTPVTVSVSETNGSGLITAEGKTSWVLHPSGTGIAVLPLQHVFAAAGIPLTAALTHQAGWERASYAVYVHAGMQGLGSVEFHAAL